MAATKDRSGAAFRRFRSLARIALCYRAVLLHYQSSDAIKQLILVGALQSEVLNGPLRHRRAGRHWLPIIFHTGNASGRPMVPAIEGDRPSKICRLELN